MLPERTDEKITFLPRKNDPFRVNLGSGVEVTAQNTNHLGVYAGMTTRGDIVLQPHVMLEISDGNKRTPVWDERAAFISGEHASMFPHDVLDIKKWCKNGRVMEPEYFI